MLPQILFLQKFFINLSRRKIFCELLINSHLSIVRCSELNNYQPFGRKYKREIFKL